MAATLSGIAARIERMLDPSSVQRIARAGGEAGKRAVEQAASSDLGGDRSFSGFPQAGSLSVDYSVAGTSATVSGSGPWGLAEEGRKGSGLIEPRTRQAVLTPGGPRAWSRYGPSRGLRTWSDALDRSHREVNNAWERQFRIECSR